MSGQNLQEAARNLILLGYLVTVTGRVVNVFNAEIDNLAPVVTHGRIHPEAVQHIFHGGAETFFAAPEICFYLFPLSQFCLGLVIEFRLF